MAEVGFQNGFNLLLATLQTDGVDPEMEKPSMAVVLALLEGVGREMSEAVTEMVTVKNVCLVHIPNIKQVERAVAAVVANVIARGQATGDVQRQ